MSGRAEAAYKRVLLKVSGEAFGDEEGVGLCPEAMLELAKELADVHASGVQVALVVGGGNIIRGAPAEDEVLERATADYMGMLATVINALGMQSVLENMGVNTRVLSAIDVHRIAEPYIRRRATRHLEKGRLVIFASGTGNPFFTTDTAAALRALEIDADVLLKGTKVDGVYSDDPVVNPKAKRYDRLSYLDAINENLRVMDTTALSLCMENKLPIIVFDAFSKGNMRRAVTGEPIGTLIEGGDR